MQVLGTLNLKSAQHFSLPLEQILHAELGKISIWNSLSKISSRWENLRYSLRVLSALNLLIQIHALSGLSLDLSLSSLAQSILKAFVTFLSYLFVSFLSHKSELNLRKFINLKIVIDYNFLMSVFDSMHVILIFKTSKPNCY